MRQLPIAFAFALCAAALAIAACRGDDDDTPTPPPATATPELAPTATRPADFPFTLGDIDFVAASANGPVWPCEGPMEFGRPGELSQFAGTPWQIFGERLPDEISEQSGDTGMTSCDGQMFHLTAALLVDPLPGTMIVVRLLQPESWAAAEGPVTPDDLQIDSVSGEEVVWYGFPNETQLMAWYSVPVEDGYIVTKFQFISTTEEEMFDLLELFLSYDP